jgi:hypothetical protein
MISTCLRYVERKGGGYPRRVDQINAHPILKIFGLENKKKMTFAYASNVIYFMPPSLSHWTLEPP